MVVGNMDARVCIQSLIALDEPPPIPDNLSRRNNFGTRRVMANHSAPVSPRRSVGCCIMNTTIVHQTA